MTKCKNPSCTKEVVSIEGRRPKEFCSVECRTKFHNSKNKKEGGKRGRPPGARNRDKKINPEIAKNINTKKLNDPKEGSGAFYLKYGAMTYEELKNK